MTRKDFLELFREERHSFQRTLGRRSVSCALIDQICPSVKPCTYRDIGFCTISRNPKIVFVERILSLPENNIIALVRHELGHAFDPLINEDGAEQRADDLAELVSGKKIRYDRYDLQTIGRGVYPRPLHLHR